MPRSKRVDLIEELHRLTGKLSALVDKMLDVEMHEHWTAEARQTRLVQAVDDLRALADRLENAANGNNAVDSGG